MNNPRLVIDILHSETAFISLDGKYFFGESQRTLSGDWTMYIKDSKIFLENDKEIVIADKETTFTPMQWSDSYFIIKEKGAVVSEKKYFKGAIEVALQDDKIIVSNRVDVDFFISSIMDWSFKNNNQLEFLKVMAIVFRSYFIKYIDELNITSFIQPKPLGEQLLFVKNFISPNPKQLQFHYKGISLHGNDVSRKAIEETKGIVMYCNSQVVALPYTYCCGGVTETGFYRGDQIISENLNSKIDSEKDERGEMLSENVVKEWIYKPEDSYCRTQKKDLLQGLASDALGNIHSLFRWNNVVKEEAVVGILNKQFNEDIKGVRSINIIDRTEKGSVKKIVIEGELKNIELAGYDLMHFATFLDLPSLAFIVEGSMKDSKNNKVFTFNGAGKGHRAGVCMLGAMALSQEGKTMKEIIHHYYKDIYIAKQY